MKLRLFLFRLPIPHKQVGKTALFQNVLILYHTNGFKLTDRTVPYHITNLYIRLVMTQDMRNKNLNVGILDSPYKLLAFFKICCNGLFAKYVFSRRNTFLEYRKVCRSIRCYNDYFNSLCWGLFGYRKQTYNWSINSFPNVCWAIQCSCFKIG